MLDVINSWSPREAAEQFKRCCGSTRWVERMVQARPFASFDLMVEAAEANWVALGKEDFLEAFSCHPKIGDIDNLRTKYAAQAAWSEKEQSGVGAADEQVLHDLAAGNAAYEKQFGYIFIVCATGKSAGEMLVILQSRLSNAPDRELAIAAGEQNKITRIRLERLWQEAQSQPTC